MKKELIVAIGVAALMCAGSPAHADVDARAVCKEKKAKAAGKKASDLLKAFGKNVMRPSPPTPTPRAPRRGQNTPTA